MAEDQDDATSRTRAFLEEWFRRLTGTGFGGGVFLGALDGASSSSRE